jgi:hypothetical protein
MDEVMYQGSQIADAITSKLSAPVNYVAAKTSALAGTLPNLLATQGDLLGNAIAIPVQLGTSLTSGVHTALNGILVGVPVGIGSGVAAGVVGLKEHFKGRDVLGELSANAMPIGQFLLKPVALLAGANSMLLGKAAKITGYSMDLTGAAIHSTGQSIASAGSGLKGFGSGLIWKGLGTKSGLPVMFMDHSGSFDMAEALKYIPAPILNAIITMKSSLFSMGDQVSGFGHEISEWIDLDGNSTLSSGHLNASDADHHFNMTSAALEELHSLNSTMIVL